MVNCLKSACSSLYQKLPGLPSRNNLPSKNTCRKLAVNLAFTAAIGNSINQLFQEYNLKNEIFNPQTKNQEQKPLISSTSLSTFALCHHILDKTYFKIFRDELPKYKTTDDCFYRIVDRFYHYFPDMASLAAGYLISGPSGIAAVGVYRLAQELIIKPILKSDEPAPQAPQAPAVAGQKKSAGWGQRIKQMFKQKAKT